MLFYKEDILTDSWYYLGCQSCITSWWFWWCSIIILSSQVTPALLCSHSKLLWLHLLQALGVLKKMQFNLVTGTWWVSGTSWMKMLLKCEGAPKWHHSEIKEVNTSTTADFPKTECRESQFYSLSFRQAVAGSKVVLISSPPPNFDKKDWLQFFCYLI